MSETEQNVRPLYQTEKDIEEFKKEIEENLKNYSKIELKNYNKDKEAYKSAIEEALKTLQDYSTKTSDLLTRINNLKKEDEDPSLKEKDFKKRQTNETKKVKDLQTKIEKTSKKLTNDLDKQKKADEKEEAKKAKQEDKKSKKTDTQVEKIDSQVNKNLREIIKEALETDKNTKEDEESENEEPKQEEKPRAGLSLREMMADAKKKREEEDEDVDEEEEDEYESEKEEREKEPPSSNLVNIYKSAIKRREQAEEAKQVEKVPSKPPSNVSVREPVKSESEDESEPKIEKPKPIEKVIEKQKEETKKRPVTPPEEESEKESEGEEMEEKVVQSKQEQEAEMMYQIGDKLVVIESYEAEIEDDLNVKKGEIVEFEDESEDPDYVVVKNSKGESGSIPSKNVRAVTAEFHEEEVQEEAHEEEEDVDNKEDKKKSKKKKEIKSNELIVNETVPYTFSDSTLAKFAKNPAHSYEEILKPQLSSSHLNFHNFFWDSKENKIRNRNHDIQKSITIHKCVNIPVPNKTDLEILSRTLRVSLFDGVTVIGNIHTIRAHIVGKDERTWIFEDDYSNMISIFDFSEFFLIANANKDKPNLGLLFELSIYAKKTATDEETELCCGWAHLPFFDDEKNFQLVNKSYDLVLNGGSVYDKNMPLDPNVPRNQGAFNDIITKLFKESKIKFNVREPTSQVTETLNVLATPLICSSLTASFIKFYYEELAVNYLIPLSDFGSFDVSTEPVHSEFLKTFPNALVNADILNAVRISYNFAKDNLKRDERNDPVKLRKLFMKIYNELCYPLLFHYTMPQLAFHKHEFMSQRQTLIEMFAKKLRKENSIEFLLDENNKFEPFNIQELRYEIFA